MSANFAVVLILLAFLFILVNSLASRRYARWDLTRAKITQLSDKTRQTLKALAAPVRVTVFFEPSHPLYELIRDLLKAYEAASPNITAVFVDQEQDVAKATQLVEKFHIEKANVVVFEYGSRHKHLADTDLADLHHEAKIFNAEDAFTSAIISLAHESAPTAWIITGHGEKSIEAADRGGLSDAKQTLEQQNIAVEAVTLLERTAIPDDVRLIIIAGPTHRFADAELALLRTYLDGGGRLLALLDPQHETGMAALLASWGITEDDTIVVDPSLKLPFVSAANLFVTHYTEHPIVDRMQTVMTIFPLARSIRPAADPPKELTVTPLASTSEAGWGETDLTSDTFVFNENTDLKGPVSIAVASERAVGQSRTRLVAVGDSDFIMNAQLGNVGNKDFFMGAIFWLMQQEQFIGIGPKPLEALKLHLTEPQLLGLSWASVLTMPLLCGLLGVGVWFQRRQ